MTARVWKVDIKFADERNINKVAAAAAIRISELSPQTPPRTSSKLQIV